MEISPLNKRGTEGNFSKVLWGTFQEQVGNILKMHFCLVYHVVSVERYCAYNKAS